MATILSRPQGVNASQHVYMAVNHLIYANNMARNLTGDVNSSLDSAAYMRQGIRWPLVQIMVCRLYGTKPLSKPTMGIVNWTLRNKLQWNFNQNTKHFIHENAFENIVCEMAATFSRERWVKAYSMFHCFIPIPSAVCGDIFSQKTNGYTYKNL